VLRGDDVNDTRCPGVLRHWIDQRSGRVRVTRLYGSGRGLPVVRRAKRFIHLQFYYRQPG